MSKKKSPPAGRLVAAGNRRPRTRFATDVEWEAQWPMPPSGTAGEDDIRNATEDLAGRLTGLRGIAELHRARLDAGDDGPGDLPSFALPAGYYMRELRQLRFRCTRLSLLLAQLPLAVERATVQATVGAHVEVLERALLLLEIGQSGHNLPPVSHDLDAARLLADPVVFHGRVLARLIAGAPAADGEARLGSERRRVAGVLMKYRLDDNLILALRLLRDKDKPLKGEDFDDLWDVSPRTRGARLRQLKPDKGFRWIANEGRKFRLTDSGLERLRQVEAEIRAPAPRP